MTLTLPYPKTDINLIKHNITFDEIQNMDWDSFADFCDGLRKELLDNWDEKYQPPMIGKSRDEIINQFNKLKDYDIDKFYIEDDNYPSFKGWIKNFSKMGSSCIQFFPALLKTQIDNYSMYDWFSSDELKVDFRRTMVVKLRKDGMYSYSRCLKQADLETDVETWIQNTTNTDTDFWLELTDNMDSESVVLDEKNIELLKNKGYIESRHFRNILDDREPLYYNIRHYKLNQKLFPNIIQIFRLGFGQVPVNFPPLTSRWICENYLDTDSDNIVYDMCSGWGGRLLGSLSANRKIHYVGTDVNSNNFGCYEKLGEFYNEHCNGENTFDIFTDGCEVIHENKQFQKYKGKLDLCFTSPPYFCREMYSDDVEQSFNKYPNYKDWVNGFLNRTIKTCYEYLKPNKYMLINIADVKVKDKDIIPLEQDTISESIKCGFSYEGKYGMTMTRMIGLNTKKVLNSWFDIETRTHFKYEPILIFKKNG